ncbi:PcfB family protein [Anaerovoracaceae bacterium 42-11]
MNYGGDAAEQVVRMSLEGMDVALRVSGSAAKNLVAILAALSKEDKTSRGRTRLTKLIKSGKELTVFSIPGDDLKNFAKEAKQYGVLYCVVKSKAGQRVDGAVDIITRAEDAPKINRIVERFKMATVSTQEAGEQVHEQPASSNADKLLDEVLLDVNPQVAGTEEKSLFGQDLRKTESDRETFSNPKLPAKPSVREKLNRYREMDDEERESILKRVFKKGKEER